MRKINGDDLLFAIGNIDEKLLAYPKKSATRAMIFKKSAVACLLVFFSVSIVLMIANGPFWGLLKGGAAAPEDSNNADQAPGAPGPDVSDPEFDCEDSESTEKTAPMIIDKNGKVSGYTTDVNNYYHFSLQNGFLELVISDEIGDVYIETIRDGHQTTVTVPTHRGDKLIAAIEIYEHSEILIYSDSLEYPLSFTVVNITQKEVVLKPLER